MAQHHCHVCQPGDRSDARRRHDTPHVLAILEPLWQTKTETAVRLRGRLERVLDWATVRGYRPRGPNLARWRSHLDVMLPQPAKVKKAEHHAALPYAQLPPFMARRRGVEGESARALEFAILTAARSGEVRGATWAEIDLEAKTWTIAGARMKAGKAHPVPLSETIELPSRSHRTGARALHALHALPVWSAAFRP